MRKNYVTFLSPGTFYDEETSKPIDTWDPVAAMKLLEGIKERHGAKPYAFFFRTMLTAEPVPDGEGGTLEVEPKLVEKSGLHYINGTVLSYDDVVVKVDADSKRLALTRGTRHSPSTRKTTNSYLPPGGFGEDAVVVDAEGKITERGNSPERVAYRKRREEDASWEEARAAEASQS